MKFTNFCFKIKKNASEITNGILYKDINASVNYKKYRTRIMELYVEEIISEEGCAYYSNKFCSYGIVNDYLSRNK